MPHTGPATTRWARMLLLLSLLVVSAAGLSADGFQQSDEIATLKQQVRDLQARVERLEQTAQQEAMVESELNSAPVPGGWRKQTNWALLTKGMTDYRVKEILGEPQHEKTVNKFEFWEYGDGKARLYMRRLKSWEVPSGIDRQ